MKLYNFAWGPYPRRVHLYLAEKGLKDLALVEVEFPHQPALWPQGFLKGLNPAHSLPVLETNNGPRIGQSIAILEYLEEIYPTPDLIGATPEARATTREWIALFDEATAFFGLWARQGSAVNADRHMQSLEAAAAGAARYLSKLRVAEEKLVGPFLAGSALSMADCVAMALLEFTEQFYGVPLPKDCPKLASWYAFMSSRPTVTRAPYPEALRRLAHGLPRQTNYVV
jgi:glutathione S-transferase